MRTITLEEAESLLPELLEQIQRREEFLITRDQKPIALLTGTGVPTKPLSIHRGCLSCERRRRL
jgi:antitoxin (DNA-binding transcriptional repressor) of toxin-antitoxin stability system